MFSRPNLSEPALCALFSLLIQSIHCWHKRESRQLPSHGNGSGAQDRVDGPAGQTFRNLCCISKGGSTSELEFSPFRRGLDFSSSASGSLRVATLVDCWSRRSIKEQLDIMLVKSWIEQSYERQTSAIWREFSN